MPRPGLEQITCREQIREERPVAFCVTDICSVCPLVAVKRRSGTPKHGPRSLIWRGTTQRQVFIFKVILNTPFARWLPVLILLQTTECEIHTREKDAGSATAAWFADLLSSNPWFAKVVPNVSSNLAPEVSFMLMHLVPDTNERFTWTRDRLRDCLHLRLYQHGHLPTMARLAMLGQRRDFQACHFQAHSRRVSPCLTPTREC